MKVFASKKDTWLVVIIYAAAVFSLVAGIAMILADANSETLLASAITILVGFGLPLWLISSTRYIVEGKQLRVHCGPFKWVIPVYDIYEISETNNPISSPALSLDRLAVRYGKQRKLMISPLDKTGFIDAVRHPGLKIIA